MSTAESVLRQHCIEHHDLRPDSTLVGSRLADWHGIDHTVIRHHPESDLKHVPADNDDIYEQDTAYIRSLLFNLTEALAAAGLTGTGEDEISVKVRCFSRLGVPIEMEG